VINRRDLIKYGTSSLFSTVLLNSCQSKTIPPNIIVLIADDLRWDCMGIFNKIIQTPNLDKLAHQGIVYLNNFVTTAICATSRASIFTGLYARHHQIWDFETALTQEQWSNTYHNLLKKANYSTAFIGKWGLGDRLPQEQFDYWAGFPGQGHYYTLSRKEHLTSYLTGQAENFISQQTNPFCLTLSYKAPHVEDDSEISFIPDPKFAQQYRDLTIPKYQQPNDWRSLPDFLQNTEAQTRYEKYFATEDLYQTSVKNYYRLISGIDESVGRIIQAVKQKNFTQDTYIIFTSDNGFFLGEKRLAGKWFGFEPAIKTPLIISCINKPRAIPKKVYNMSLNVDIAPTILALGKVKAEPSLFHGHNIATEAKNSREWLFYEHLFVHPHIPKNVGIRSLDYKYLFFPQYDYEMLFNLQQDPLENLNLAKKESYLPTIKQFRQLVKKSALTFQKIT
jgi:arylsulfatase A-like enzyme